MSDTADKFEQFDHVSRWFRCSCGQVREVYEDFEATMGEPANTCPECEKIGESFTAATFHGSERRK